MRKTSEVLNKAADLIEQYGWRGLAQEGDEDGGAWGGIGKPMCLEGGILAALGVRTDEGRYPDEGFPRSDFQACPSYRAVQQYLGGLADVWVWNDVPHRTKEEVIEVLRACAVIEEAKEKAAEPQKVEVSA